MKLGLDEALGEILCYTNSARTPPKVLHEIIEYSLANPGRVVKVSRKTRDNWVRKLGSVLT